MHDSNQEEELKFVIFRWEGGACISSTVRQASLYLFAVSTEENSETLKREQLV